MKWIVTLTGLLIGMIVTIENAIAQVTSDGSLPTPTNVTAGPNYTITGGSSSGNNLFHSFSQFSVPFNGSAVFNNAATIQNIFSRVTGSTPSDINGVIKTNNPANLFLLNPSGIIFGPNASLDIGGSFLGTTAESVQIGAGSQFSATAPNDVSLLSISTPIGLQMGNQSGLIRVDNTANLQVNPGETLALISNSIESDGGILTAESGQIELGSVQTGAIALDTTSANWKFDYNQVQSRADIHLTQNAQVDVSGTPGGAVQLYGQVVQIEDGSSVLLQHQGAQNAAGQIRIDVDSLELIATDPTLEAGSIRSENISSGQGANINVAARQIRGNNGGRLDASTAQNGGRGGNITVNVTESIDLQGFSPLSAPTTSRIYTPSLRGGGVGGDVFVTAPDILLQDGAAIASLVFGGGGGGGVHINSENLSLIGENKGTGGASFVAATTFFGGDAGIIDIQTERLFLQGGGVISASTSEAGNAGQLSILARDSIEVNGAGSVVSQPSRITASGQKPPGLFQQIFGLPDLPTGNAGDLSITSPNIQIRNQGYIAAENLGSGDAGSLTINADSILLDQQGQIRTATTVGEGGSLVLNIQDVLLLRHGSLISAEAGGFGNSGNILLNAPIIVGVDNSDIVASAVQGEGGNIQITTQGLFGLQFRNQLTAENDITASSQLGINGTVEISTLNFDPNNGLVDLSSSLADSSDQIAEGCTNNQENAFIATGRGGVPINPTHSVNSNRPWNDLRKLPFASNNHGSNMAGTTSISTEIIEANTWQTNAEGLVELASRNTTQVVAQSYVTCSG